MNIVIQVEHRVATVRLNRPKALNALNSALMQELISNMQELDRDPGIGCFVITGSEKTFAAGADIKEMAEQSYIDMSVSDYFSGWDAFNAVRTPKIAAVSGYAFGGGCELAMMCDTIFASETAIFGQPEIKLGVIPGMGGTQRLTRLVGKALAMDMILTGRSINAHEAKTAGLVARVLPPEQLMNETLAVAADIAAHGKISTIAACESVNRALELNLSEGILFERRNFHALFSTRDQKEGMQAFIEKREAKFTHQ